MFLRNAVPTYMQQACHSPENLSMVFINYQHLYIHILYGISESELAFQITFSS
jgi:hypothetical protein